MAVFNKNQRNLSHKRYPTINLTFLKPVTEARLCGLAYLFTIFVTILKLILLIIFILISVAFVTLLERKILGYIQKRKGPNKLGFKGIIQPFSDAVKLLVKESLLLNLVKPYNLLIKAYSNLINLTIFMNYLSFFPRWVRSKTTNYLYFMLFISWGLPDS
ncbi:NADH-ubiquinone oxidoreductase chain 1 [Armadillidium vulgare]|nr:NADH-ubiquinone oxidoreductase chain 1 [Armadillidium vulgare]